MPTNGDESRHALSFSAIDRALLTQVLEVAPFRMALFDLDMRYVAVSPDWCSAKNTDEQSLLGRCLYDLEPSTPDHWRDAHRRCLNGATETFAADRFVRPGGDVIWFNWAMSPVRDAAGDICGMVLFARDVTADKLGEIALRDAEMRLRASEEQHRLVFYAATYPCSLSTIDRGVIVEANDAFVDLFGVSREAVIGKTAIELGIVTDTSHRDAILRGLRETGFVRDFESTFRRKDGVMLTCRQNADRLVLRGQEYLLVTTRDITEQRRLERALDEASAAEQHKLGRQLHEGLGQDLAGISLLATAAAAVLRSSESPAANDVTRIADFLGRSVRKCRALAQELSPLSVVGGDLQHALAELVRLQQDAFAIDADLEVVLAAPIRLGATSAESLYRIAQEAVSNARRHGHSTALHISLDIQESRVRLQIHDNGEWLSPGLVDSPGMGLRIMEYRAKMIGGHLNIGRAPQGGTIVTAECPNR